MKFFSSIKDRLVHILSCCDRDEKPVRMIEIGEPTNFRRVDITLPGLSEQQQASLRAKARSDVDCIFAGLPTSPMPSPTPPQTGFTQTSAAISTTQSHVTELSPLVCSPVPFSPSKLDKFMQHARRVSQRFSLGDTPYEPVHAITTEDDRAIHMSSVDVSRRQIYDSKAFEDRQVVVEWSGRDSVTLGGSDRFDGEKSSVSQA